MAEADSHRELYSHEVQPIRTLYGDFYATCILHHIPDGNWKGVVRFLEQLKNIERTHLPPKGRSSNAAKAFYRYASRAASNLLLAIEKRRMEDIVLASIRLGNLFHYAFDQIDVDDRQRGRRITEGGHKGALLRYGDAEHRKQRDSQIQQFIDHMMREEPMISYSEASRRAADEFGLSDTTVKRKTRNPRPRGKRPSRS